MGKLNIFRRVLPLLALLVLSVGSAWAATYTITLGDNGTANDGSSKIANASATIDAEKYSVSTANFVSTIVAGNAYVYQAKSDFGWKFGNSSNAGKITINLTNAVEISSVKVTAKNASSKVADIKIGGNSAQALTSDFAEYTQTYSAGNSTSSILIETALHTSGDRRAYITSIVITTVGGGDTPSTPTALSVPTNLASSNVTTTSATLSWDEVSNASSYTVKIGSTEYTNVNTNSYSATGLTAGTQYTWSVKAVGDGVNYTTSAYAANANFTTEAEQGGGDEPSGDALTVDFESETSAYTDWTFTNITTRQTNSNVSAHGGSYFGSTDGKTTGSVQTKNKVNPATITFYISKTSTNTTSSNWKVQTSTNGTSWTDAKTASASSVTRGEWTEVTHTFSNVSDVYVRVYYDGTTAVRCIDDLTLTLASGDDPDPEKTVTGIAVTGTPETFWKGDTFNHNGMTVTATYDDETNGNVTSSAEFSTPDMSTPGTKTVTVTYQGQNDTYEITVQTIANTAETAYTVAQAVALIDAGKDLTTQVYVAGKISQIDSYDNTYNSITYWISADGTTTDQFEVYSGKNLNNTDFAAQGDIVLGADVVIYGVIKKYKSTYEFDKNNYLVSYTAPVVKTKPELSFAKPSVTAYLDALDEFESLTVVTNPVGLTGVQYATSDDTKATVDANTGVVTISNEATPGNVTITASYAESEDYAAADDASYVINIVANKPVAVKRAIVAQMGETYYAATTEVSNNKLVAVKVSVVDNKVVYTGAADITWNWEATVGTLITNDNETLGQTGTGTNINFDVTNVTWQIDATLGLVNAATTGRALVCNGSVFGNYSKDNVGKSGYTGKASLMEIADGAIAFAATTGEGDYYATFSSTHIVAISIEPSDEVVIDVKSVYVNGDGTMTMMDFENDFTSVNDGMDKIIIPANTGVLVHAFTTAGVAPVVTYDFVTEESEISEYDEEFNMLRPASEAMTGSNKFYKLAYGNWDAKSGLGFYYGEENGAAFEIKEGTAYLAVPTSIPAPARFVFNNTDQATGIENVENNNAVKFIESGVLYILRDGVRYNALGQMVK